MSRIYTISAVSGSLRTASLNTLYLNALKATAPDNVEFHIFNDLESIPPFNVDKDENPPSSVSRWKAFLEPADLIVLCSPEYAHGVSGVMKNALDWLVSSYLLIDRPIALPNISVRATHAQEHMYEVIRTMGFSIIEECSLKASHESPLVNIEYNLEQMLSDKMIVEQLNLFWDRAETFLAYQDSTSSS
ncbi:NADPH-dependent FMN reductase [Marinomonas mediterranea]|uniref:NADPH-dependent FMN reductase n=1 Tax=Marinomonas mediterranea (strain ATCC 700492 / JCM 21426 / NBRC 103028 / MMB-1) TaxID=717774 RepID=F2K274_MARM1|nr:NADPH-dependent FMN reductase [Marinomonas mediterranea]ADZ91152.1 NADPH-dependent FMN reductase [Marinomonas mediterranea MMB-1]WCN09127.1 FMN reductase [Marinomonas mediterranea]WCN17283.1 FMN reductase [Marinomonas mediterranea MMB-1]